jgi:guanylate kinase
MPLDRRGVCLVLAAPSGAGKTSITRALLATEPELTLSISVTTRPPRPHETEGVHYHFITQDRFGAMQKAGELLESAGVYGRSYGSPRIPVETALAAGRDVAFDIDWQGYRQVRAAMPADTVGLFIMPPSMSDLESRLRARASDSPEEIARRLAKAREEMSHVGEFDYVLVNRAFDDAVAGARAVLHAARLAATRQIGLASFVAGLTDSAAWG